MNGAWPAHEGQGRQRSDVRAGEVPTARDARSRTSGLPCSGDNGSHCAAQTIFVPDAMKRGSKRDSPAGHVVQMCESLTSAAPSSAVQTERALASVTLRCTRFCCARLVAAKLRHEPAHASEAPFYPPFPPPIPTQAMVTTTSKCI